MAKFTVGDVVLVVFPFSDLKGQKIRPALVIAKVEFDNLILCQITSKPYSSKSTTKLAQTDFVSGSLPVVSFIRPDKLFTADISLIRKTVGKLAHKKKSEVMRVIRSLFKV